MRKKTMRAFLSAAVASAALAVAATPALAGVDDDMLGGPPDSSGVTHETRCPEGEAVTAVEGSTRLISGFIPIVAVATVRCTDGASATSTMGSGSGTAGSTSCPQGQVAVGIMGREGDFVDHLALRCQNSDGSGVITTTVGFGGPYGTPDGPYDCPAGTVLTGLRGQSVFNGETIRYVAVLCTALVIDRDGDGIADTPPPTHKAQCRDDGWKRFNNPTFRNQGDCVSYTERAQ